MTRHFVVNMAAIPKMRPYDPVPPPHPDAIASVNSLHHDLNESFPDYVASFDQLFKKWQDTWSSDNIMLSSNSADRAKGPEFEALVELGPRIVPLVIHKLLVEDNFFAAHLYDVLEKDEGVKVDPSNILDYAVMQRHANLLVDMNHQRNVAFEDRVVAWKDKQQRNRLSSSSSAYVSGEAYESLVELGEGIIANVMIEYVKEPGGWWHVLLHRIIHGETVRGSFVKDQLYNDWKEWFEQKPYTEAPMGFSEG
jgi:hypothetical protein